MALNKVQLKAKIKTLTESLYANPNGFTPEQCREQYATEMANAIDEYVRTGLVTVATTGTATAQTGTGNIT